MPETGPDEPSPRRTLSRLRRDKKHTNESSTSLASSLSTGDDSVSGVNRLRHSMDTALDRVKDRTRKTIDKRAHTPEGESRRLSNLVPGSHKRREKRNSIHQDDRQLSVQSGDSGLPAEGNYELGSRSGSSLLGDGSGRSSLLTDEEPDEATASAGYVSFIHSSFPRSCLAVLFFIHGCFALAWIVAVGLSSRYEPSRT